MIDLNRSWWEQPIALVTLSPLRKDQKPGYDRFAEIGIARLERGAITDVLTSFVLQRGPFFASEEWELRYVSSLMASDYRATAPAFASLLEEVADLTLGAVPAAVSPDLVKPLLLTAVKNGEKKRGSDVDRTGRFALRPKSRWLDLRLWRHAEGRGRSFPGPLESPIDRLQSMARAVTEISDTLHLRETTISQLIEWQEDL